MARRGIRKQLLKNAAQGKFHRTSRNQILKDTANPRIAGKASRQSSTSPARMAPGVSRWNDSNWRLQRHGIKPGNKIWHPDYGWMVAPPKYPKPNLSKSFRDSIGWGGHGHYLDDAVRIKEEEDGHFPPAIPYCAAWGQGTIECLYWGSVNGKGDVKKCWVAREIYGEHNPNWRIFRYWLETDAPKWFHDLYVRYGKQFASFIKNKPLLKTIIKKWMDTKLWLNKK